MNKSLKVSVVTACYNNATTIENTIQSVCSQTYPNLEHVFIDGGSTDETLEIISSAARVDHSVLSEPDYGIYDALNKGISRSTGDIVGFLHADDFFATDDVVAGIADCFIALEVQAVYGDLQYVSQSDSDRVIRKWHTRDFTLARLKRGWSAPHPTFYVRKHWYEKIGGFDTQYRIAADYLSMLRFFSDANFNAAYLPRVLVKMRVGGTSNGSVKNIIRKSMEDYSALKQTGTGGLGTLMAKNARKLTQFL